MPSRRRNGLKPPYASADAWLVWRSPFTPPLEQIADLYRLRFCIEHRIRFAKQSFHWAELRVRTPDQFDRWTDLLMLTMAQLALAHPLVPERHLPWKSPHRPLTRNKCVGGWFRLSPNWEEGLQRHNLVENPQDDPKGCILHRQYAFWSFASHTTRPKRSQNQRESSLFMLSSDTLALHDYG